MIIKKRSRVPSMGMRAGGVVGEVRWKKQQEGRR